MHPMDSPAADVPETANPVAEKADVEQQQGADWGRQFLEAQAAGDTSDETARLLLAAVDERILAQAQDSGSGGLSAMISRLVAADTNWHQCTVYFLSTEAEEDAELRAKAPLLLAGSCVIVAAQCATAMAICMGNLYRD